MRFIVICMIVFSTFASADAVVDGTVYDGYGVAEGAFVTIMNINGSWDWTDVNGEYAIDVIGSGGDSFWIYVRCNLDGVPFPYIEKTVLFDWTDVTVDFHFNTPKDKSDIETTSLGELKATFK